MASQLLSLHNGTLNGVPDKILSHEFESRLRSVGYQPPCFTPFDIWKHIEYMVQSAITCMDGDMAKMQQCDIQHIINLCKRNKQESYYDSRDMVVRWLRKNKIEYSNNDLDYY